MKKFEFSIRKKEKKSKAIVLKKATKYSSHLINIHLNSFKIKTSEFKIKIMN